MLVKCKQCGKKIDRDKAYKVTKETSSRKVNHYYCSEFEYINKLKERQYKAEALNTLMQFFKGINTIQSLPKILLIDLAGIANAWGWEATSKYLSFDTDYIKGFMNKDFKSEDSRAKYISAIIRNRIEKVNYNQVSIEVKNIEEDVIEIKKVVRKGRAGFANLEGDI